MNVDLYRISKVLYSLSMFKEIAVRKGGHCLEIFAENSRKKGRFRCKARHEWVAELNHIKNSNSWCPFCRGYYKFTLEDMRDFAAKKRWTLLSTKASGVSKKHLWRCEFGHEWESTPTNIMIQGTGCPKCRGHNASIEDMEAISLKYGGKCLSSTYTKSYNELRWRCAEGHEFSKTPSAVKQGQWCSYCKQSIFKSEEVCRAFIEHIFESSFPKKRPKWLVLGKSRLELDGYNKKLCVAFEYQGEQHFKFVKPFHKNAKGFSEQRIRDEYKLQRVNEEGVELIVINFGKYESDRDLFNRIVELISSRSSLLKKVKNLEFPHTLNVRHSQGYLKKLKLECQCRGYRLLSKTVLGLNFKVEMECPVGHRWSPTVASFFKGHSCIKCYRSSKEELIQALDKIGAKMISKHLGDVNKKHEFRCQEGHQVWQTPNKIFNENIFCKECGTNQCIESRRKSEKGKAEAFAKKNGIKLISTKYINWKTKYTWSCLKCGERFSASYRTLTRRKTKCLKCGSSRKMDLEFLQNLVEARGGQLLSPNYHGSKIKHQIYCINDHCFSIIPSKIIEGVWCRHCHLLKNASKPLIWSKLTSL